MADDKKDRSVGEVVKEELTELDRILIITMPDAYPHKAIAETARKRKGEQEVTPDDEKEEIDT